MFLLSSLTRTFFHILDSRSLIDFYPLPWKASQSPPSFHSSITWGAGLWQWISGAIPVYLLLSLQSDISKYKPITFLPYLKSLVHCDSKKEMENRTPSHRLSLSMTWLFTNTLASVSCSYLIYSVLDIPSYMEFPNIAKPAYVLNFACASFP